MIRGRRIYDVFTAILVCGLVAAGEIVAAVLAGTWLLLCRRRLVGQRGSHPRGGRPG